MSIDPRLIERRKTVAEDNAKRNVSRLLKFLVALVLIGGLVWLALSPWLSVSQVDTTGVEASPANSILADHGVIAGTPMIRISAGATELALLADPWIAEADVTLHWPDRVEVEIVERTAIAWTRTGTGWTRRAVDGVALPSEDVPDEMMARVEMPEMPDSEIMSTPDLLGALEFIDALPESLRTGAVLTRHDGELWASIGGYRVRLGRADEMREKAISLRALMEKDPAPGSVLVLMAPTNPAVLTPAPADAVGSAVAPTSGDVVDEATTEGGTEGAGDAVP